MDLRSRGGASGRATVASAAVAPDKGPGLLSSAYRAVLIALVSAVALASYNNLSVTAALPVIGSDLGSIALLPWVVTVELLAGAIAVLFIGPFIDGWGVARVFRLTIVGFIVSSLMCALAPSMQLLIAARALQGFGAGSLIATAIASVGLAFDARIRSTVYALVSSVWGLMGIGGPALAAALVSTLGWRAVLAVNVPVGVLAGVIGWRRLPGAAATAEPLDRRGLMLMSTAVVAFLLAASFARWWSLGLLLVGGVLVIGYASHERQHPAPIVKLDHIIGIRWRNIHLASAAAVTGGTGASVYLPLYLRGSLGTSEAVAAFSLLWPTLGWSTAAWGVSKLLNHMRAQTVILVGSVILSFFAIAVTVVVRFDGNLTLLLVMFFGVGWGIGTIATSGLWLLQHRAEDHEMGRISSAHQFIRSLGFAYGAAVAGLVLFGVTASEIGDVEVVRELLGGGDVVLGVEASEALASAYTWSLAACAATVVVAVPAAVALVRRDRSRLTLTSDL